MPQPSRPSSRPPATPGARAFVERVSLPWLLRLSRLPRAVPFLALLAMLVAGVWVGGPVGFVLMALVTLFVAWLMFLGWPRLTTSERLARLAVLLLAVALCVTQLFPRT